VPVVEAPKPVDIEPLRTPRTPAATTTAKVDACAGCSATKGGGTKASGTNSSDIARCTCANKHPQVRSRKNPRPTSRIWLLRRSRVISARFTCTSSHIAADAYAAPIPLLSKDSPTNLAAHHGGHAEKTEAHRPTGLSLAELWPESDRALVNDTEAAIAGGRCAEAIELADGLVRRTLTSAAALFGSADPSRDAVNLPLLLGIDGRRYLAFRSMVRAARGGAKPSQHDALVAYAFAIEVRAAKTAIR
jgi:hypothetical protein